MSKFELPLPPGIFRPVGMFLRPSRGTPEFERYFNHVAGVNTKVARRPVQGVDYRPSGVAYLNDAPHTAQDLARLAEAQGKMKQLMSRMPNGVPRTAEDVARLLPYVNPLKGTTNCAEISLAVSSVLLGDARVAGRSPANSLSIFPIGSPQAIEKELLDAGHRAQGNVQLMFPDGGGHGFNAINLDNKVWWVDGQIPAIGDAIGPNAGGNWFFVLTERGKH
ncbi:hypothetical protein [Nonomuraea sp. NPDC049400]|uniref:hypothetical protein n=1 Tax=Nonomuraea sp. NPDC049400 TaxID=3364352 RepID=UPI00378B7FC4